VAAATAVADRRNGKKGRQREREAVGTGGTGGSGNGSGSGSERGLPITILSIAISTFRGPIDMNRLR
jgi:hypothetical protein